MHVGVARAVHFADTEEELEAAQVRRLQGICGSTSSPSSRATSASASPAMTRPRCGNCATTPRSSARPTRSPRKLEALRDGGAEYVIVNFGGSIKNIRRFAREIMPHFAGEPRLAAAAK